MALGKLKDHSRILNTNDQHIIKGCKKGDKKAQTLLYQSYKAQLFGICLRYAADRQEAEDLLQESFMVIYRDLYQYKPIGSLAAWLKKVTVNVALQHLRKKKRLFPTVQLDALGENIDSTEDLFSTFRASALLQLIQQLPPGYRAVFNMYVIEGYSHKEIAQQLGINLTTSKSQLSRAKHLLRKMLEKVV